MSEYLVGVYKEVGKSPNIVKIKNQKDYLEKLLDGECTNIDYDDYTILYKKQSDNLLANIYVDQYSKIGVSLKGKIFAVSKDEKGNIKSLNKDQVKRCITFFLRESFNYRNFDEHGRYIPRAKRKGNKKIFNNKKQNTEPSKQTQNTMQENSTNITLPTIQLSEEQTLNMILKVVFIILDFVKGALQDSDEDE